MKKLVIILATALTLAFAGNALAVDFSTIVSGSSAAHMDGHEPDYIGAERWVGALWDCWQLIDDEYGSNFAPNAWGAGEPGYLTPSDPGYFTPTNGIERPYIPSGDGTTVTQASDASMDAYLDLADGQTFSIWADNFNTGGPDKTVTLTMRYRGAIGTDIDVSMDAWFLEDTTGIPPLNTTYDLTAIDSETENGWTTAVYRYISTCPNPFEEVINIAFAPDSVVDLDWVIMDTECNAVPVPGAVWLLGSGLFGLAGLRRKLRK